MINLLDAAMAKRPGGIEGIRKTLPMVELRVLPDGVLLRGAKVPAVGHLRGA